MAHVIDMFWDLVEDAKAHSSPNAHINSAINPLNSHLHPLKNPVHPMRDSDHELNRFYTADLGEKRILALKRLLNEHFPED